MKMVRKNMKVQEESQEEFQLAHKIPKVENNLICWA